MVPFAIMQAVYGPVSDVIGRRPTLMIGLAVYLVGGVVATMADSFSMLLIGRAIQGAGLAATRVLTIAIIRDRFAGREMARVMSITMMVFIIVPIVAPASGSLLLLLGTWHLIFGTIVGIAVLVGAGSTFACRKPCIRNIAVRSRSAKSGLRSEPRSPPASASAMRQASA